MTYTGKFPVSGEAIDIPTMANMSLEQYREHLEFGLFFVDHHGVLRSGVGEFPLAVTPEQFEMLLKYLISIKAAVGTDYAK